LGPVLTGAIAGTDGPPATELKRCATRSDTAAGAARLPTFA
jgi:hypothetical protein